MSGNQRRFVVAAVALICIVALLAVLLGPEAASPTPRPAVSPSPSAQALMSPVATESSTPELSPSQTATYRLTVVLTGAENGNVVSVPAGINCPTKCSALFPAGTVVQLVPQAGPPPTGYNQTWMEWAESCPGAGTTCEATMRSNQTFHATFHLRPSAFALAVTIVGGSGTVVSMPAGINCGATCTASFSAGDVTLMAAAAMGYVFVGWSGACSGTAPCTISLGAETDVPPATVTATFAAITPP